MKITRLKLERLERGLTQQGLAEATGLSKNNIQSYENERYSIATSRSDTAVRLAEYYQMSQQELGEWVDAGEHAHYLTQGRPRKTPESAIAPRKQKDAPCYFCGVDMSVHPFCRVCRLPIHEKNPAYTCNCGVQHLVKVNENLCRDCADRVSNLNRKAAAIAQDEYPLQSTLRHNEHLSGGRYD